MIYPASSLFLATLVFNAASVWGAPVRISTDSLPVVRSTADDILPRKMNIVDVVPHQRSIEPEQVDARDTASTNPLEARDPLPEVSRMVRRYPRKVYQDLYEKRCPSPSEDESAPAARSPEVVERRFPRRSLYERHEGRAQPAPKEARSEPEPSDIQRRYPRKVYADFYQKRESSPSIKVESRSPSPEVSDSGRRFPRRVYAEYYGKRQDAPNVDPATAPTANVDPAIAANPPPTAPPADPAAATPSPIVLTPAQETATASTSVSASISTQTISSSSVPLDLNALIKDITSGNTSGYQPGTTIKETTLLVNKVTHISDKGNANQPAPGVPPPVGADPASTGTPSSTSATPSASSTSSTESAPAATATPDGTVPAPEATPSPATSDASSISPAAPVEGGDPSTPPAPAEGSTPPVTGSDASRRSLGSNQASRQPIIRRQLGYSGPAWASHLKRTVN